MNDLKFDKGKGLYDLKAFLKSDDKIYDINQLQCVSRPQFILEDRINKGNYYKLELKNSDLYLIKVDKDDDIRQYIYLYSQDEYWYRFLIRNGSLYFENAPLNDIKISDFSKNRTRFGDIVEKDIKYFVGKNEDIYLIKEQ